MKGGKEARHWYEKAADAGDSRAMQALGVVYEARPGGLQDYDDARQWYEKAALAGHRDVGAGKFYEKGLGVRRDPQKAQQWRAKENVTDAPKIYGFITMTSALLEGYETLPR